MRMDDESKPDDTSLAERVDRALQLADGMHDHLRVLDAPVIVRAFRQHLLDLLDGRAGLA